MLRRIKVPSVARTTEVGTTQPVEPPTANTLPDTGGTSATVSILAPSANRLTAKAEFDPPPGDGAEHPGQLPLLTDNDTATEWTTVCYDNDQLNPKKGVGLVFQLADPAAGSKLEIVSKTKGWSASVYVAANNEDALAKWGKEVSVGSNIPPGSATFELGATAGRYVLVWFTHLGLSNTCKLPYQMRVSEVRVVNPPG